MNFSSYVTSQQPEAGQQQRQNLWCIDPYSGLNHHVYAPQTPVVEPYEPALAPYQTYLTAGSISHQPYVADCSYRKISTDD